MSLEARLANRVEEALAAAEALERQLADARRRIASLEAQLADAQARETKVD